ncbi:T9SS type A sorting domain-containing protein [bacterium]|nr:T9SS type A sorting domain-containing protein [bacterium]
MFGPPGASRTDDAAGWSPAGAPVTVLARPGRLEVGGAIDQDTVWPAAEVIVTDDVEVVAGASLTIAAGATVTFDGFHGLRVLDGDLQAIGTPAAPITFTAADRDRWRPDLGRDGAWNGLAFVNVPAMRDSSRLRWCVIEHAKALPGDDWLVPAGPGGVLVDGAGGAVRVVGRSPLEISHGILRRNLAERGGAMAIHHGARPLLAGNLLHDNHATLRASAIWISYADAVVAHSTVTANEVAAPSPAIETGAIDHVFARPWHLGNVVWGNATSHYWSLQIREPKAVNTRYCDVENWLGGQGCLSADPLLDPFEPGTGSPVIDAAAATPWLGAIDLAGRPRVVGSAPDMGAFEAPAATSSPGPVTGAPRLRAWPNPANPRVTLAFTMARAGQVELSVYDPAGRRVRTLVSGYLTAGEHRRRWDGCDRDGRPVAAGTYVVRATTPTGTTVTRLTIVR